MFSTLATRALDLVAPTLAQTKYKLSALLVSSPEIIAITVPNAAGNIDVTIDRDILVVDVWSVKTTATGAGSAKTATLGDGTNAISSALDLATVADTVARTTKVIAAASTIRAGGKLRVTVATTAQDASCIVYVLAKRL